MDRTGRALRPQFRRGRATDGRGGTRPTAGQTPGAEQGLGLLVVERRDTGEFIGYCGLIVGQGTYDEPEIAYELAQRAHGNGYATEAGRVVVEAAARTGRKRLWATVREWNTASFRVLEKLDFYNSGRVTPDSARGDSIWMTRELDQPLA
ncbi:GNAT family N-acetyltransferase [Nocardia sp. CDC160]|uniref:GNAT family N-acetyltransferase n=1 Tax=Nocardia sp. CDC160 TaxID=3112166 RepID=UPI002DBEB8FB|nr:GNAT family N-acetyltransferase [Nocardia sp. CDC160]MEC3918609.1 GNAT family N-acetyltransferase [Nocardia sp. CDC160]